MFYVFKLHAFDGQPSMEGRLVIYESRNLYFTLTGFCTRWVAMGGRTQHSDMPPTTTAGKNM